MRVVKATQENPFIVKDYPYGYKLRTELRAWIETNPTRGERLVTQTINPKNGRLNAPKKSTYDAVKLLLVNDENKFSTASISKYSQEDTINKFLESYKDHLSDTQLKEIEIIKKMNKIINNAFEQSIENAKNKERIHIDTLQENEIISNLDNYFGESSLYEISIVGNALKKRCRKKAFVWSEIGYMKNLCDDELILNAVRESKKLDTYKDYSKMTICVKKVKFKRREKNDIYSSLSRMLMQRPDHTISIDKV